MSKGVKASDSVYDKYDKLIFKINKYKNIFVGTNTTKFGGYYTEKFKGNSVLIETNTNEYIFVDKDIYKFITTTPITKYYSVMGNSNVPYPFAISKDKIYLMNENKCMDYKDWDKKRDPYQIYYQLNKKKPEIKFSNYTAIHHNKYSL